jgi:hypothetical protein
LGDRLESFVALSALLTGFDRVALLGTGTADSYLDMLRMALPDGVLGELLAAYDQLPTGPDRDSALASDILGDSKLGPVARNVILLWYCGTWTALPSAWHDAYGCSPLDVSQVVSGEAYQQGLQWVVAGAHPMGARQQGYGAWSVAPEGMGG